MNQDIVDLPDVLERVQNDKELLIELLDIFLEDCPTKIHTIKNAIKKKDITQLRDAAHSMKGASGNISAKKLHGSFLEIEQMARNNDLASIEGLVQTLDGQFQEFKDHAVKLKEELRKPS